MLRLLVSKLTTCVTSLDSIERSLFSLLKVFPHWAHADSSFIWGKCRKPIIHHTIQWYFWRTQLRSDATWVMGPDRGVRFWGSELTISSGYEVAGSPHHLLDAGLHSCVGLGIGQTKPIRIHVHLFRTPGGIHMHSSLIKIIFKVS